MTAGPGDEAGDVVGRGYMRASGVGREHVIDVLKAAFVQGRLTKDEFDMRLGQAFAARTYGELAALTADVSAGLVGARALRKPAQARGRLPMNTILESGACVMIGSTALVATFFFGSFGLYFAVVVAISAAILLIGLLILGSWHEKRSDPATARGRP